MLGICHICQQNTVINFCNFCSHWLCPTCSGKWKDRALAAIKELSSIKQGVCCGPSAALLKR